MEASALHVLESAPRGESTPVQQSQSAPLETGAISVVVPIYLSEAFIDGLLERAESLDECWGHKVEFVFVVDGSPDRSHEILREQLPYHPFRSQLLLLSRNFGSFAAIRMGLEAARGSHFIVMAADMQEPADMFLRFEECLRDGETDLVVGTRRSRQDPLGQRLTSSLFWAVYCRFVQPDMPKSGIDVFGCTKAVRDALLQLHETNTSLVGQLIWLGFRRREIEYDRLPRRHGRSGWTFLRRYRYFLDSLFSFTDAPIHVVTAVGVLGILTTSCAGIWVLISWWLDRIDVKGYVPIIMSILFSTSLVLTAIGAVGQYVWRCFENSKQRPLVIPMCREQFEGKESL